LSKRTDKVPEKSDGWPVNVGLVDTLYRNTEAGTKPNVKFSDLAIGDAGKKKKVIFYNWYLGGHCECSSRSWCHPFYLYFSNPEVDVYLAARDLGKTLFRMDSRGCFKSMGFGLSDVYISELVWDHTMVFEINAFMHPEYRALSRRQEALFPMFALSEDQLNEFNSLNVTVIADDSYLNPPNAAFMRQLSVAYRVQATKPGRERKLVYPAEVWAFKNQIGFLQAVSPYLNEWNVSLVFLGDCGASSSGNISYCQEFDRLVNRQSSRVSWVDAVVPDSELATHYASSLGVVLASQIDCNPRVLSEVLFTDTPFFVSPNVTLPSEIKRFGRVGDDLVDSLALFIQEASSRRKWPIGSLREFAMSMITEDVQYAKIFESVF
jgi:hypothetical protein